MTATSVSQEHRQGMRQRLRVLEEELHAGSVPVNRVAHHLAAVIAELEGDLAREEPAPDPATAEPAPVRPPRIWPTGLALAAVATAIGVLAFPVSDRSGKPAGAGEAADGPGILQERAWPAAALRMLQDLTIQSNGRFESMDQFSRQTLLFVTGTERFGGRDPVQTVLSMVANPQRWRKVPIILVESSAATALGLVDDTRRASWSELMGGDRLPRRVLAAARKQAHRRSLTPAEREVLVIAARCMLLEDLFEQHLYLVSPASQQPSFDSLRSLRTVPSEAEGRVEGPHAWAPILAPDDYPAEQQIGVKRSWSTLLTALRRGNPERITEAAARMRLLLHNLRQPMQLSNSPQALTFFRD
ncbi:MAG: hypothetical protein HY598_02095 [Candidatus Omnitrophica bacterium]|nr:hypothetical protein [Candidatus Omnitrophota bacterium]